CIYYYREFFFFFSSRRRHTRSLRDWSSDVCSSDLSPLMLCRFPNRQSIKGDFKNLNIIAHTNVRASAGWKHCDTAGWKPALRTRSEERRVGKECRSQRWRYQEKKKKNKKKY